MHTLTHIYIEYIIFIYMCIKVYVFICISKISIYYFEIIY